VSKDKRHQTIKELVVEKGYSYSDLLTYITSAYSVKESTVKSDLKALYDEEGLQILKDRADVLAGEEASNDGLGQEPQDVFTPSPDGADGPAGVTAAADEEDTPEPEPEPLPYGIDPTPHKEYSYFEVVPVAFDPESGELMAKPFPHTVNKRTLPKFLKNHYEVNGMTILRTLKMAEGEKWVDPETLYEGSAAKARARAIRELSL
jgi:hypothetical protein